MFGKGILAELINDLFQKKLFEYINEEKLNVVGQPLLADGQEQLDFDVKDLGDFELKFELGQAPDFEVNGLEDDKFKIYKVSVAEEMIDEDLNNARLRLGTFDFPEEDIEDNDSVTFDAKELDGDEVKEDGLSGDFSIWLEKANEAFKETLLTKKKGDVIQANILELEDLGTNGASTRRQKGIYQKILFWNRGGRGS